MRLSIVIPVGPGEQAWRELLPDLAPLEGEAEIVLVAVTGGTPAGFEAAEFGLTAPTRWLESPAGRARQLNAGARAARGERLCFLHADSRLPRVSLDTLRQTRFGENTLHYFDLRFLPDGPALMRLNRTGARLRSRWLGMPFGDQGLALRRSLFERLGGFDETIACGEDHALVWRARRAGVRLVPFDAPLLSSARRYAVHGWWRTTARHLWLTAKQALRFSRTGAR